MIYFAYGSNMSLPRLADRVEVLEQLGNYELSGYQLKFHMHGKDDSAKADAHFTGDDSHSVMGVLFRINPDHREKLDFYEGLGVGYDRLQFDLSHMNEPAFFYVAKKINQNIAPFCWYKHHVVFGAMQAKLPLDYIDSIREVSEVVDGNETRKLKEMAIYR